MEHISRVSVCISIWSSRSLRSILLERRARPRSRNEKLAMVHGRDAESRAVKSEMNMYQQVQSSLF